MACAVCATAQGDIAGDRQRTPELKNKQTRKYDVNFYLLVSDVVKYLRL